MAKKKLSDIIFELLIWSSIIELYLGIWIDTIRWKFIFTSLFTMFLIIVGIIAEEGIKKKHEEEKEKEKGTW